MLQTALETGQGHLPVSLDINVTAADSLIDVMLRSSVFPQTILTNVPRTTVVNRKVMCVYKPLTTAVPRNTMPNAPVNPQPILFASVGDLTKFVVRDRRNGCV